MTVENELDRAEAKEEGGRDSDDDGSNTHDSDRETLVTAPDHVPGARRAEDIRRAQQEHLKSRLKLFLRLCGSVMMLAALVLIVVGTALITSAEGDRLHGWRHTSCTIVRNYHVTADSAAFGKNGTVATEFADVCVYFSVHADDDDTAVCAVPAGIAGRGNLVDPPACSNLPTRDELDVAYWRLHEDGSKVECMVPTHGMVPASRCVAAATTGGPGPTLWRTWQDRFVYLMRDPRESTRAIDRATSVQFGTGIGLLVLGPLLFCLSFVPMYFYTWMRLCAAPPRAILQYGKQERRRRSGKQQ